MNVDQFISHLEAQGWKSHRQGPGYRCQCPAHGGQDRNLAVDAGVNGGVVVSCKSHKCSPDKITGAVGLTLRDLMPPASPTNGHLTHEPVAVYPYRDEQGAVLFEKVREARKHFWCRKPGEKKGGIAGVRRVLFGLPELLKTAPGELVAICEGEKDAINVARLGMAATTNFEGAEVWTDDYTQWLKAHLPDRRFVILPDNDEAGQKHALLVAGALSKAGLEWLTLKLPGLGEKGDVSDWIAAGGTGEALRQLSEPQPHPLYEGLVTGSQLAALVLPEPESLVPNLIYRGFSTLLAGDSKLGKSSLVLRMLLAMASGGWWLDRECRAENRLVTSRVLFLNFEDPMVLTQQRALRMMAPDGIPDNLITRPVPYGYSLSEILEWLKEAAKKLSLDAVVLDPIAIAAEWEKEEDNARVALTFKALQRLAAEAAIAILSIHHVSKKPGTFGLNIRGASAIKANVMGYLLLEREREQLKLAGINKLTGEWDVRLGRDESDLSWWIEETHSGHTRTPQQAAKDSHKADLLLLIGEEPGVTTERLAELVALNARTCWDYLREMEGAGLVFDRELPRLEGQRGRAFRGWFCVPREN